MRRSQSGHAPLTAARQLKMESSFAPRRKDYSLGVDWGSGFSSASLEDGWQRA